MTEQFPKGRIFLRPPDEIVQDWCPKCQHNGNVRIYKGRFHTAGYCEKCNIMLWRKLNAKKDVK